jgi:exonuclease VII large subunit
VRPSGPPSSPPSPYIAITPNDHSGAAQATILPKAVEISDEWEEKYSSQHQKSYWKNKITGEKTWKNPLKLQAKEKKSSSAKAALEESKTAIKNTLSDITKQKNERFAVYDKMKKMLPEGAVRQKMSVDGFSPQEIDEYYNVSIESSEGGSSSVPPPVKKVVPTPQPPPKATAATMSLPTPSSEGSSVTPSSVSAVMPAALAENSKLKTYDTMRKMLPEGAVRQKMKMDGISERDIDAYFGATINSATAPTNNRQEEQHILTVKHKLRTFNVIILFDIFLYLSASSANSSGPVDERYEKFVKMRKMLPDGPVRQKMSLEGDLIRVHTST